MSLAGKWIELEIIKWNKPVPQRQAPVFLSFVEARGKQNKTKPNQSKQPRSWK
jgi:hypothetical protein